MFEFFETILVRGGPNFAASMTRLDLVDEYQITWVPPMIGAGHSPFADLEEHLKLDVVSEQRFASGAQAQIWSRNGEVDEGFSRMRPIGLEPVTFGFVGIGSGKLGFKRN